MNKLIRSFKYAIAGIYALFRDERNAKIHLVAAVLVIVAGLALGITRIEWCFIFFAIALVLITEAINTAIEETVNSISEERKPQLGKIKDIAAGAVLIAAVLALLIAAFILIPYVVNVHQL